MNTEKRTLVLTPVAVTFDECLRTARKIMTAAGNKAAEALGDKPPKLVETRLPDGSVRIVMEWSDGEQTNEYIVQPIGGEHALNGRNN